MLQSPPPVRSGSALRQGVFEVFHKGSRRFGRDSLLIKMILHGVQFAERLDILWRYRDVLADLLFAGTARHVAHRDVTFQVVALVDEPQQVAGGLGDDVMRSLPYLPLCRLAAAVSGSSTLRRTPVGQAIFKTDLSIGSLADFVSMTMIRLQFQLPCHSVATWP